jgi:site-specific DNA-methyltransferase (adenine-specific)
MKTEYLDLHRMDCMDLMAEYPDNHFDLAIVDPPYASKNIQGGYALGIGGQGAADQKKYSQSVWSCFAPESSYFLELFRVSKNQIIWGANHFGNMPKSSCWIVWDKRNENTGFADCELAWASFNKTVRKFEYRWNGMLQGDMKNKEHRIHPTQKPVKLYNWLLANYAKPGQRILDTHMGSGSIAIACHYFGAYLTATELDEDYFNAACERIERETRQQTLFA